VSETAPDAIEAWLEATPFRIGQILGTRTPAGGFVLCHRDDGDRGDLAEYEGAEAAAEIARYDDAGKYRPLKTAPNLRHGWRLLLAGRHDVRLALDLVYPARLAAFSAWKKGRLVATPLRETLNRQTGMYRAAMKIADEEADGVVADFCRSDGACLRTILWRRDAGGSPASTKLPREKFDPEVDQTGRGERALPMLCQEACNLLVAEARKVVKLATK